MYMLSYAHVNAAEEVPSLELQTYKSTKDGYSFQIPADWEKTNKAGRLLMHGSHAFASVLPQPMCTYPSAICCRW